MEASSFEFNGVNFYETFGIKIVKIDYILPPKRERKIHIPNRHGKYDFGAECWEERIIRLECDLLKKLSRAELREVSSLLSKKGKLILWDEPDKHYIGEIYSPSEIFEFPQANIRTFSLEFICEPFAYTENIVKKLNMGVNDIEYYGTEEAPCLIRITNDSNMNVKNINIRVNYIRR